MSNLSFKLNFNLFRFSHNLSFVIQIWCFIALVSPIICMQQNGIWADCTLGPMQINPSDCQENKCSDLSPYQCPNGFCAISLESCALTSNCPLDRPFICPNLVCVSEPSRCLSLPAFKHRPPFVVSQTNISVSGLYQGSTYDVQIKWDTTFSGDFNVYLGPVSDEEIRYCDLLADNADQEKRIRLIVQPGTALYETDKLNSLLILMSPVVNVTTEGGGEFPAELTISLQVNPYFDYSSYVVGILDMENGRIRADNSRLLQLTSISNTKKIMTFTAYQSGIYAIIYFPNTRPDIFYGYLDCGWACIYPREFMMCFFSVIYMVLVFSMTFWCIAVQTEQKRIDRKKAIRKQQEVKFEQKQIENIVGSPIPPPTSPPPPPKEPEQDQIIEKRMKNEVKKEEKKIEIEPEKPKSRWNMSFTNINEIESEIIKEKSNKSEIKKEEKIEENDHRASVWNMSFAELDSPHEAKKEENVENIQNNDDAINSEHIEEKHEENKEIPPQAVNLLDLPVSPIQTKEKKENFPENTNSQPDLEPSSQNSNNNDQIVENGGNTNKGSQSKRAERDETEIVPTDRSDKANEAEIKKPSIRQLEAVLASINKSDH